MRCGITIVLSVLWALSRGEDIQADIGAEIKSTGNAGLSEPYNRTINLDQSTHIRLGYPNARFIYVRFSKFDLPPRASLTLHTNETTYVYTGRGRPLGNAIDSSFYSDRLTGDMVDIYYKQQHAAQKRIKKGDFGLTIGSYIRGMPRIEKDGKSLVNPSCVNAKPSWKPAVCYKESHPSIYNTSRGIARMVTLGASGIAQYATGFLVGCNGYFITNEHNVRTQEQVDATDFGFLAASATCEDECNHRSLGCSHKLLLRGSATLIATDTALDYTLLRFSHEARNQFGRLKLQYLKSRQQSPDVGEEIYITQHPDGTAAKIVMDLKNGSKATIISKKIKNRCGRHQLGYHAETIGGSSGSPVIATSDNRVIGLHHCGECNAGRTSNAMGTAIPFLTIIQDLIAKEIKLPKCFFE